MRVRVWVEQEVEVDVPLEDVFAAIEDDLPADEQSEEIRRWVSRAHAILKHVTDEQILRMPESHRKIIASGLQAQVQRYWV